jgi:hypothetical protein
MKGTVRLYNGETWIDATKGDFLYAACPVGPRCSGRSAYANLWQDRY